MEKNQTTGLLLITGMLIMYFTFFAPDTPQEQATEGTTTEEVVAQKQEEQASTNAISTSETASVSDSLLLSQYGFFGLGANGTEQEVVIENADIKVFLNAKGGKIAKVILKNYLDYKKQPLVITDQESRQLEEVVETPANGSFDLNKLFYQVSTATDRAVTFTLASPDGKKLERTYSLDETGFTVAYDIHQNGLDHELLTNPLKFNWLEKIKRVEKDVKPTRDRTTINYYTTSGDFDYLTERSEDTEEEVIEGSVAWLSFKQKFFNIAIITEDRLENVSVKSWVDPNNDEVVKTGVSTFEIPTGSLRVNSSKLRYYFGPNDYEICSDITEGFRQNVQLGWFVFRPINKYLIIPVFNFLSSFISNYGIVIFLLVVLIKGLLFPLTYKSYLSMAKMRVLKPEMDALTEKYGDDMQRKQQETMKLYGKFGVNPLAGCIPMVAQMPVLFAMFNFFPNAIALRQQGFLWADDLSSYDSIIDLSFSIPFYGDHVSLFTLLMTVSSVAYAYFNNQISPTAATGSQAQMKYITYISPVFIMFFLNDYAAGLTYYYFVSNVITIAQQLIARQLVDEDKIRQKLEENSKKNATTSGKGGSKFMQRLNDAMKASEEMKNQAKDQKGNNKGTGAKKKR